MKLALHDPAIWAQVAPYLDKAFELDPAERETWLEELTVTNPAIALAVRELLDERERLNASEFLARAPFRPPGVSSKEGSLVGAYTIIRLLGRGGMSEVWLAERHDGRFEGYCAVKFLDSSIVRADMSDRFLREGKLLGRLTHPNIARLIDAGATSDGKPYLALEYVDGERIDRYCQARNLGIRDRVRLFLDVVAAVAHAHSNLIVHRDLKPSNVFVTAEGVVKLLDFGIAKLLSSERGEETHTRVEDSALTPEYAAPEQLLGEPPSTATDVYQLGLLLYVLLTGQHPLQNAGTRAERIRAALDQTIPRASDVVPKAERGKLRGDLDAILAMALRKEPHERYGTAAALREDLQRHLDDEPVVARRGAAFYRTKKFVARHRLAVAASLSAVLILCVVSFVAVNEARNANRQALVANSVQKFLEDIFKINSSDQSDPQKARSTTARELLDLGAAKLETALSDVPESKIQILDTLSSMYYDLGLDDKSVELARKAVDLAEKTYGVRDTRVADQLIELAGVLQSSSKVNDRGRVLDQAQAILDRAGDDSSTTRANLLRHQSQHFASTELNRAIALGERGVALYRNHPGDPNFAEALADLADAYGNADRSAEALVYLREAIAVERSSKTPRNSYLVRYLAYAADGEWDLRRYTEAERDFREALELAARIDGGNGPDSVQIAMRLGLFLCGSGRPAEGLNFLATAADVIVKIKGPGEIFHTPHVFAAYGVESSFYGRPEKGLEYVTSAVENRRKNRPNTLPLAQMLEQRAMVLIELGDLDAAKQSLDEAEGVYRANNSKAAKEWSHALDVVDWLLVSGDLTEAGQVLAATKIEQPANGSLPRSWVSAELRRAKILLAKGDAESAVSVIENYRRTIDASPERPYVPKFVATAALIEGKARLALKQPELAFKSLSTAIELGAGVYDPNSPWLGDANVALARCYLDLHQRNKAAEAAAVARGIFAAHPRLGEQYLKPLKELESLLATSH